MPEQPTDPGSPAVPPRFVVESLVRSDGSVDLGRAYDVANSLGVSDQTLRLAVRRMVADGSFVQEGRGRRGVLRRTGPADLREVHDGEFVELAYLQDAGEAPWDGRWRLLAVTVPERQRPLRDRVRRTLVRLGGGQLHAGLYASPHDWQHLVLAECPELSAVEGVVFASADQLEVGGDREPRSIAARVWDLEAVQTRHEALLGRAERAIAEAGTLAGAARTAAALELAWVFDGAHGEDPLLPPELLPPDWVGRRARAAFAEAWVALTAGGEGSDGVLLFERFA